MFEEIKRNIANMARINKDQFKLFVESLEMIINKKDNSNTQAETEAKVLIKKLNLKQKKLLLHLCKKELNKYD